MKHIKWPVIVIGIFIAVFLLYQTVTALANPISTEIVTDFTDVDGIKITGVIIRDEEYIRSSTSGTMHFEVSDGERVAKNGVVAGVYSNAAHSLTATKIDEVEAEIADIEEILSYNDLNAVDLNLVKSKIYTQVKQINKLSNYGNLDAANTEKADFLSFINRKQVITGETVDFSSQLTALKAELAELNSKKGNPISSIRAKKSGYFVSTVDGYETVLSTKMLESITPEFLENLQATPVKDTSVKGKLVSDYIWYIAATVSIEDSMQFKVGDVLTVNTALRSNPSLEVTVDRINLSPANNSAVIILSCQQMNGELARMRTGTMTVVKKVYKGLKVNSNALRIAEVTVKDENGNESVTQATGVYVISGMTAKFVPVNILYSTKSYAVCEIGTSDNSLRLYDEIVVKGKNMYNGKIID